MILLPPCTISFFLLNNVIPKQKSIKYIFISGGVLSGVGKGITTASIALLLKSSGYKVSITKCDMYLNVDAGTMNPIEHGEVFVTHDRMETDQDIGNYERFLGENLSSKNYITAGQIYLSVLQRERRLEYEGKTVDTYEEIPEEIIRKIKAAADGSEIALVEFGGTVGEYQNIMFYEAVRRMKLRLGQSVALVHVGYLPLVKTLGELKSKPLQQSIQALYSLGLHPDFIVARAEKNVDEKRLEKIAFAGSIAPENVFSNPDVENIYEVPLVFERQKVSEKILKTLGLKSRKPKLTEWKNLVKKSKTNLKEVTIGLVGKYVNSGDYSLQDAYLCVNQAIKHAAWSLNLKPKIIHLDSEKMEIMNDEQLEKIFKNINGLVVPQGWGKRGVEGKIKVIKYARENNLPFLGLCFGMQMAAVEFARNVAGLKNANSQEVNQITKYPVIHIMPDQEKYLKQKQYGGTIRLGDWECKIEHGTILHKSYKKNHVLERHRHRFEFNNKYKKQFEKMGLIFSGTSPDGKLIEAIELDTKIHPFFVGVQFHPELISRPLSPHPLFVSFIEATSKISKN